MENNLEQLLNSLIEKGWKPFGIKSDEFYLYVSKVFQISISYYRLDLYGDKERDDKRYSYRELASKESGLWQFVCENNLNYSEDDSIYNVWLKYYAEDDHESPYTYASPVWYLIESSLKDESELEDFLLSNIKVDGTTK